MPNYSEMTRSQLIEEMKRLRREEADIRQEYSRILDKALAPVAAELSEVWLVLSRGIWRENARGLASKQEPTAHEHRDCA